MFIFVQIALVEYHSNNPSTSRYNLHFSIILFEQSHLRLCLKKVIVQYRGGHQKISLAYPAILPYHTMFFLKLLVVFAEGLLEAVSISSDWEFCMARSLFKDHWSNEAFLDWKRSIHTGYANHWILRLIESVAGQI